jgi:hypothetical protein
VTTNLASPSDDELAAIVAAVEMVWPQPQQSAPITTTPLRWRFAGRWWTKPIPVRRDRPW